VSISENYICLSPNNTVIAGSQDFYKTAVNTSG
jgi:hypothetical protein